LAFYKARRAEDRLRWGPEYEDHGLGFAQANGRPLDARHLVQRDFEPLMKRAFLPRIRFHDLRHSHATHLLRAGVNPKVVQERLGHSRVGVTMDVYSHVLPGMQAEAAQRVDAILAEAGPGSGP
jgi:integrase